MSRRRFLQSAAGAAIAGAFGHTAAGTGSDAARSSHFPFGPVAPPRTIPSWPVLTHEAQRTDLAAVLKGRTTALQLMFTGCSATCPIEGALFAQAQRELHGSAMAAQLVSCSIDPLSDTPAALAAWLRQFAARPGWLAVAPRPLDVDGVVALLGGGGESSAGVNDRHTGQVYLIDRHGQLLYRTASMPEPSRIVELLRRVDGQA